MNEECVCLEAWRKSFGDDRELAAAVWPLEKLAEDYLEIIARGEVLAAAPKIEEELTELWQDYLSVLAKDPFLPSELLPARWPAERTRQLMRRLCRRAAKQAEPRGKE